MICLSGNQITALLKEKVQQLILRYQLTTLQIFTILPLHSEIWQTTIFGRYYILTKKSDQDSAP